MTADRDRPPVASESGRPAASDDPVTRDAAVAPDEVAEENAAAVADEIASDAAGVSAAASLDELAEEEGFPDDDRFEELRELGWSGTPFVVHEGQVLGNTEMYEAAERLGLADDVPLVPLDDLFREAGYEPERLTEGYGPDEDADEIFAEDFLHELPRHIRDKYEL